MYQNVTQSNSTNMQKLAESQTKFEEASLVITRQSAYITDLTSQIEKLKDNNAQLEYQWEKRYTDMENSKDLDFIDTCNDYKN